jgi:hypothetical protein
MSERWKPEYGETYYYVWTTGHTASTFWTNTISDKNLFERGNCFRTEKEAESAAEKIKALLLSLHDTTQVTTQVTTEVEGVPDWCKIGEWCYCIDDDGNGKYFKITQIKDNFIYGDDWDIDYHFIQPARLRPYNEVEMKALVGNTVEYDSYVWLVIGYNGNKNTIFIGNGSELCVQTLMSYYRVNGKPAGIFEHLENGVWIV